MLQQSSGRVDLCSWYEKRTSNWLLDANWTTAVFHLKQFFGFLRLFFTVRLSISHTIFKWIQIKVAGCSWSCSWAENVEKWTRQFVVLVVTDYEKQRTNEIQIIRNMNEVSSTKLRDQNWHWNIKNGWFFCHFVDVVIAGINATQVCFILS